MNQFFCILINNSQITQNNSSLKIGSSISNTNLSEIHLALPFFS